MAATDSCFHCSLPNPPGSQFLVTIDDEERRVCCPGCKAVAELIRDSGMGSYYALRDAPQPGEGRPDETAPEWEAFNGTELQGAFVDQDNGTAAATIYIGGMYCSACSWLIETRLSSIGAVESVEINPITHRTRLRWRQSEIGLGDLLEAIARLGFRPRPLAPGDTARPEVAEQRTALKRLLVASLGMMQVMMFAVGLYAGGFKGIDADMQHFLRLVSFFVATPVVFYAAKPFFISAWRGVRRGSPGMDLPVAIAIGAAYAASVFATFTRGPAVWFDSVAMFVFFLTLGRYLEMRARHRSVDRSLALSQSMPDTATRLFEGSRNEVAITALERGDIIVVRPGDAIPADGVIVSGSTAVDEALLTGEARPQLRRTGDDVAAGSVNVDQSVQIRVERTGGDTTLSAISRMSEQARFARPSFVGLADRLASYVVVALLLIAVSVAVYWSQAAPELAFEITLSVLVVTCPCALALATPAAFAAAASRLADLQLLMTNGDAIEVLSRATHVVFDKTGTLTSDRPAISSVNVLDEHFGEKETLCIAAALEQVSSHPLAAAFHGIGGLPEVSDASAHTGLGVSGTIDGDEWRLGKAHFACDEAPGVPAGDLVLSRNRLAVASIAVDKPLRSDAVQCMADLRELGVSVSLASGDHRDAVEDAARALGIEDVHFDCTPEAKRDLIRSLQARGERVVMVGDGINDAPVLAAADASIAPGNGALLAQTNADLIMLGDRLQPVTTALWLSRATMRVVRQNLAWAVGYNATALPLAVVGWVPPWLAAVGMSASSLVVVLNALRLNRMGQGMLERP